VILTTSRKPSRKTRSLAKALSRFMNWRYVQRGKMSLEDVFSMLNEGEKLAILSEVKGNPAILRILDSNGKEILWMRFNVSNIVKVKMDDSPVVFLGRSPFDPLLLGAIPQNEAGLKFSRKMEFKKRVVVRRDEEWITFEFWFEDVLVFKMRVKRKGGIKIGG